MKLLFSGVESYCHLLPELTPDELIDARLRQALTTAQALGLPEPRNEDGFQRLVEQLERRFAELEETGADLQRLFAELRFPSEDAVEASASEPEAINRQAARYRQVLAEYRQGQRLQGLAREAEAMERTSGEPDPAMESAVSVLEIQYRLREALSTRKACHGETGGSV